MGTRIVHRLGPKRSRPTSSPRNQGMSHVINSWRRISVSHEELKLENVLPTGQAFRWQRHETDDKTTQWTGIISGKLYTLQQTDAELLVHSHIPEPGPNADATISRYFQLNTSIKKLASQWKEQDPSFDACTDGVRILKQDPLETLLAFICSSNNNIPRISKMMNQLCRHYGNPLGTFDGRGHHTLPTLESLLGQEDALRELGFGYRAKYIVGTSRHILESCSKNWLESLEDVEYEEAWLKLQELPGVGPKVADCVCLMGLGISSAVPIDVHMCRVASKLFHTKAAGKSMSVSAYREIGNMFRERYGDYAGWTQAVSVIDTTSDLQVCIESLPKRPVSPCNLTGVKGINYFHTDMNQSDYKVLFRRELLLTPGKA